MLAFYLAAPEVENDRRARKEGRYMGRGPIGYANKTDEIGRKYIAPQVPQSGIIGWAFEEIAKNVYNTEQVYKMAKEKGFSGIKSRFWFATCNPVYCGNIYENGGAEKKREVISSMYPEKLTFDGDTFRTTRTNEAARLIYSLDKGFGGNKKGQNGVFSTLSSQVGVAGCLTQLLKS